MTEQLKGIYLIEYTDGNVFYRLKAADASDQLRAEPGATMRFVPDGGHIHSNGNGHEPA